MRLEIFGVEGLPEINAGDDLASLIAETADLADGDVVVVTQKIVSKAEGAMVAVDPDDPLSHKPVVEQESVRVLRRRGDLVISETKHGFVCANAGVDRSNVDADQAALLPDDPDKSARRIRDGIKAKGGLDVGVIVSDTFGRPWRRGVSRRGHRGGWNPPYPRPARHRRRHGARTSGHRGGHSRRTGRGRRVGHGQGRKRPGSCHPGRECHLARPRQHSSGLDPPPRRGPVPLVRWHPLAAQDRGWGNDNVISHH